MQSACWASRSLQYLTRALCLVMLLIAGQQGAVVHELAHVADVHGGSAQRVVSADPGDGACMLCPLFAQAGAAAFSHALAVPLVAREIIARIQDPAARAAEGSVPTPRSRGPPSSS